MIVSSEDVYKGNKQTRSLRRIAEYGKCYMIGPTCKPSSKGLYLKSQKPSCHFVTSVFEFMFIK